MQKIYGICVTLVTLVVLVVPAGASAEDDGILESPTGTVLLPTHESSIPVRATNVAPVIKTNAAGETLSSCSSATLAGSLETNTGTPNFVREITIKAEGSAISGCMGFGGVTHWNLSPNTNGLPWCLRSTRNMTTDQFQVRGNDCTSPGRPIRFVLTITSLGLTCTFQRNEVGIGAYTTHPEDAILNISGIEFNRFESSVFCPSVLFLDMSLALERDTGEGNYDNVYIKNHAC